MVTLQDIILLIFIGLIIYIAIAYGSIFKNILDDIENAGHTALQAIGGTLEKLDCCTSGCPGINTNCNASQIKSMYSGKNPPQGYNICNNCKPSPCKLPSYNKGMSCGMFMFSFIGGLLLLLFSKQLFKSAGSKLSDTASKLKDTLKDYVWDPKYITETDRAFEERDFDKFNITKDEDKVEYRKFIKIDPDSITEDNIPELVKNKMKDGKNIDGIKKWLKSRNSIRSKQYKIRENNIKINKYGKDKSFTEDINDLKQKNSDTQKEIEAEQTQAEKDAKDLGKEGEDNPFENDYPEPEGI